MTFDYDVAIIGGAFSGAATALMLKRKHPGAASGRILRGDAGRGVQNLGWLRRGL